MRHALLFLLTFLLTAPAWAQDVLTKQNGDELQVKVLEISPTEVKYKRTDNPDGPLISVRKSEVFMIRYANGTKEILSQLPAGAQPSVGSAPAPITGPVVPGDEEPAFEHIKLGGPRLGFTVLTGGMLNKARGIDGYHNLNPFLTQFGWQFETRIFRMPNGTAGLFEIVPLIGGLEQGKFIPSINGLIGIRGPKGFEFGLGPNLTPVSANIALAVGTSFHANGVNFPVNFAVVPGNGGARFSLLFGFNSKRN
ncbi:hypothetical protein [Hymenobacter jejuensis]|uniref:Uncharacterized protein n=1 Tax=Hymenobacter jejuensis TaxID=2502781 RepID=A0A5B8A162_9BACT|nr:hypothetical protein [Hymenobacter jejuensis]QDA60443.1 hypothetical protein FHG12_10120 [Hymenobacter jejuensis]